VASERNYHDSILSSMSSGVLTIDREGKLAKVNPAAARILEAELDQIMGVDARAWMRATNPAVFAELEDVVATGRPKILLDVDVRTAGDNTISANLSIVPLVGQEGPEGLLVLIEDITEGKRVQSTMRRFMTPKIVDQVMSRDDDRLFGAACRASVLFADIRGFTTMAESLQPRETVDMLNEVFTELFEAVAANDGVLDKFQGDAVMAVYGAPIPSGHDAKNAVESAVSMMRMVRNLKDRQGRPIGLGVSIATGDVIAGTIGSPKRMDYTVIGDCVNLAARLQQVSKVYRVGVVVCEATAAAVAGGFEMRELDIVRVRGRNQSCRVFEVLTGPPSPASEPYRTGREMLRTRRWGEAVNAFEAAAAADPADRPSALMLARARNLALYPPGADWDEAWDPG
jgi:adenylate cyclase